MLTPCSITTTQSPGTLNYRHCCSCCCTRHTAHTTAACVAVHKPTDLPKIQTITRPLRSPDESTAGHKNAAIHHRGQVPVSVYRDGEYTCGPLPPHHDTTPRVTRHSVRHYPGPRGFTTPPLPPRYGSSRGQIGITLTAHLPGLLCYFKSQKTPSLIRITLHCPPIST